MSRGTSIIYFRSSLNNCSLEYLSEIWSDRSSALVHSSTFLKRGRHGYGRPRQFPSLSDSLAILTSLSLLELRGLLRTTCGVSFAVGVCTRSRKLSSLGNQVLVPDGQPTEVALEDLMRA